MSPTVVFLWISASTSLAAPHRWKANANANASASALVREYGAARGLNFVELSRGATARPYGTSSTLADEIEAELEQAATALSALEEAAALERLARVEQALLAHPDLPQGAWLLAESMALRARAAAHTDAEGARLFEQRRAALEGPRAAPFGESAASEAASAIPVRIAVRGLAQADELEVDGVARSARDVELLPGLHQLRVLRRGRVVHAEFREITGEVRELELPVPVLAPCSADDLGALDAAALAHGAVPPAGVACPRFALVRPTAQGIEVSLCTPAGCGPFLTWRERPEPAFKPLASERRLPAWAGAAIVGVTAVAATSLVLWRAGAFDAGRPSAAPWQYGGLDPQSARLRF